MVQTQALRATDRCAACAEIRDASERYGRWLINENYNDGASLKQFGDAAGFCSAHAAKLLEASPDAAAFASRWVLSTLSNRLLSEMTERQGYRHALRAQAPCRWCIAEQTALVIAIEKCAVSELCPGHERLRRAFALDGKVDPDSPQPPCQPLAPAFSEDTSSPSTIWWSPAVNELWRSAVHACSACLAGIEADRKRLGFLAKGPSPGEHWDVPVLCIAHDAALGSPRGEAFQSDPDGPRRECSVCVVRRRAELRSSALFAAALRNEAFLDAYTHAAGLCILHYDRVLRAMPTPDYRRIVARVVLQRIEVLVWELDERAAMASWALRDQCDPNARDDAPYRASWFLSGGCNRPFRADSE